jgi:hypothetical protein
LHIEKKGGVFFKTRLFVPENEKNNILRTPGGGLALADEQNKNFA